MSDGIRMYKHPGKFEGEMLVTALLRGVDTDTEIGGTDELGWYGRIDLPDRKSREELIALLEEGAKEEGEEPLTKEEKEMVLDTIGIIVEENDQGFFSATWYSDDEAKRLRKDWANIEWDYEDFYKEQEKEEKGEGPEEEPEEEPEEGEGDEGDEGGEGDEEEPGDEKAELDPDKGEEEGPEG